MNKKMQKELSQMKYKYLLDTTTALICIHVSCAQSSLIILVRFTNTFL